MNLYECGTITFAYFSVPLDEMNIVLGKEADEDRHCRKSVGDYLIESVIDTSNIDCPQSCNQNPMKALFLSCRSTNGTVMLSNLRDGWDTMCHVLSSSIASNVYTFKFDERSSESHLSYFSCLKSGKDIRVVYAIKDPRWKFYEKGEALPFENKEYYQMKIISSRLNREILTEYCHALHLDVEKDEFWEIKDKSILFEYRW